MQKSDLLNWLQHEQQQWETLLTQVGAERMEQPGVNAQWSMKDLVAHMTTWNRRLAAYMQAAQRGEPEPPPPWPTHLHEDDAINAWIFEANHGRPARAVLDESRQTIQQIFAVLESLPDDAAIEIEHDLSGKEYYRVWIGGVRFPPGEFFEHFHDDHEAHVRAWLAREER